MAGSYGNMKSTSSPILHNGGTGGAAGFSIYARRRRKIDWAGIGIGDAFRNSLDYFERQPAQQLFYRAMREAQKSAAREACVQVEAGFQPAAKPQLGPCYTDYPAALAAWAAVGLTAFLEYETRAPGRILMEYIGEYLRGAVKADAQAAGIDPDLCLRLAKAVTNAVQTRIILASLTRTPGLACIETYRLFAAAQQDLRFPTVISMVDATVLYGDLLPDWRLLGVHPMTRAILEALRNASAPFLAALARVPENALLNVGRDWVTSLCRSLLPFLPRTPTTEDQPARRDAADRPAADRPADYRFAHGTAAAADPDAIPPLAAPRPPTLFSAPNLAQQVAGLIQGSGTGSVGTPTPAAESAQEKAIKAALGAFSAAVEAAGHQDGRWEDMRSDRVAGALRRTAFGAGPIEGSPTDGHEVRVAWKGQPEAGGEIFDRAVPLSDDLPAVERLRQEAEPITARLRRTLYPNIEPHMEAEHFRSTGTLDGSRLASYPFCPVLFRRYRVAEKPDPRGRPVLLIACDGSGSLSDAQMKMTKLLAAAWLASSARSGVCTLAGLYHSGEVRAGVCGPLVQWIHHPAKSAARSQAEAVRALVSLPDEGTGAQSDALSLTFMLAEAQRLARGRMVYCILISDCAWNQSFRASQSARDEVRMTLENAYEELGGRLHLTLLALGVESETGLESVLDKVIAVSAAQMNDSAAVAELVGVYVASSMRERRTKR